MSERVVERLDGSARDSLEVRFCLEIRGCPKCGERDIGYETSNHYIDARTERDAATFDLTCPRCGRARRVEFYTAPEYFQGTISFDSPSQLAGPTPSTIIEPHEFANELRYDFAELEKAFALVSVPAEWGHLIQNARKCLDELPKFLPASADEIPEDFFRTDAAKAARAAHPEWFRRDYFEQQQRRWDEFSAAGKREIARRDAAGEKNVPLASLVAPFSDASFKLHAAWLSDKAGGQRLQVKGVDASGKRISALDLTAAIFEDVILDRADVSYTRLHGATLTGVRARGAGFASTMIAGTKLTKCDFTAAGMPIAKLGDAAIEDCTFAGANLERTTWYRSKVARTSFADSVMQDVGIDKAEFVDCDFRGADLSAPKELPGTSMDAVFIRCDLRNTNWQGRELFRVRFIDCKLAGAHGTPRPERTVIERPDLSPDGDGTRIGTERDVLLAWGIDPDAPPPAPPAPTHRELVYDVADDEGDYLESVLKEKGHAVTKRLFRDGTALRFELRVRDPIADSIAPQIDEYLATYRADRERRKADLQREIDPMSSPLARQRLIDEIIDDAIDDGDSFEQTVQRLVDLGLSVEQAHEAIAGPSTASRLK